METLNQAANTLQNTKQYPRVGQNWSYNAWSAPISITRRYFDLMKGWYGEGRCTNDVCTEGEGGG